MPDLQDLRDLVLVCGAFVGAVLLSSSWVRAHLGPHLARAAQSTLIRLEFMSDPDVEPDPWWLAQRRRRLWADVQRLERLVATDTWMSATRQLGNRIALRQLLLELDRTPEVDVTTLLPAWSMDLEQDDRHRDDRHRDDRRFDHGFAPTVEILEIGSPTGHRRTTR